MGCLSIGSFDSALVKLELLFAARKSNCEGFSLKLNWKMLYPVSKSNTYTDLFSKETIKCFEPWYSNRIICSIKKLKLGIF